MTATETTTENATTASEFDIAKAEAFGQQMMGILSGGLLSLMVDIGHRTGPLEDAGCVSVRTLPRLGPAPLEYVIGQRPTA